MNYIKTAIPYLLAVMIGAWTGFYIGTQYYPRVEIKTVTNTIHEKPTLVQGETKTETKTQIAYIPKDTIIERYIDASGKEVTVAKPEATDLDAQIGKAEFNVRLNGKPITFTKTDDERFVFDKNKIALDQSSTITFDATVTPQVIDETRRWSIGVGYGSNGLAGKVDFPVGKGDWLGGWVYGDKDTKAGGVAIKF